MRMQLVTGLLLGFIFGLGFFYIVSVNLWSTRGGELDFYEKEVRELRTENIQLRAEILMNTSYTHLLEEATNQGYIPITNSDFVRY